jgi:hypothetical protein
MDSRLWHSAGSTIVTSTVEHAAEVLAGRLFEVLRRRCPVQGNDGLGHYARPVLGLDAARQRGPKKCGKDKYGELSVGMRKSEAVTLRHPVMPIADGFGS